MDTKNVIAAISLSAAVIILYGLFFSPPPEEIQQIEKNQKEISKNDEAPKLSENQEIQEISREDAINKSNRILFENENIFGSISL